MQHNGLYFSLRMTPTLGEIEKWTRAAVSSADKPINLFENKKINDEEPSEFENRKSIDTAHWRCKYCNTATQIIYGRKIR